MKKLKIPPFYLLVAIIFMLLLYKFFPIIRISREPVSILSLITLITGIYLVFVASRLFSKFNTPIKPFEETTHLITTGIYKRTRNPVYIGMILILIGTGFYLCALSPFMVVPVFIFFIRKDFVVKEEELLSQTFGEEYEEYKANVSRWL